MPGKRDRYRGLLSALLAIGAALAPLQFDAIYGHYFDRVIPAGGKQILEASVQRYIAALNGAYDRQ